MSTAGHTNSGSVVAIDDRVGDIWQEQDPRFPRFVKIVKVGLESVLIYQCAIQTRIYETQVFAWVDPETQHTAQTLHPDTEFLCLRCSWSGPHPRVVDTCDHYNPPLGEVPACPACGSYQVTFGG